MAAGVAVLVGMYAMFTVPVTVVSDAYLTVYAVVALGGALVVLGCAAAGQTVGSRVASRVAIVGSICVLGYALGSFLYVVAA